MRDDDRRIHTLLDRLAGGDADVLAELFDHYRASLRREIARDLSRDPRLAARFDASDVVQEVFRDAQQQMAGYLANRERIDFMGWLRGLARERRLKFQREHLDAQCRSLKRQQALPEESWRHPAADQLSPSHEARAAERDERVCRAILRLKPDDQDIIQLRVLEGLSNAAAAEELQIAPDAAAKRLERAMSRLREIMADDVDGGSLS